jgi:iron complex transport system substrate-binding protein
VFRPCYIGFVRIVSLLPSATEILFALGLEREVVGVSHECDYPPQARQKRVVIHSRIPQGAAPAEIDHFVRDFVSRGESVYAVDVQALEELAPDLIITQDLCHVCAASPDDLATALARFTYRPEVLCLNPQDLGDVWRDILWVGEETRRGRAAEKLLEQIGQRLARTAKLVATTSERPRVAFLEWLQPFYVGGHWVPEMIELAGGHDVLGRVHTPSFRVMPEDVIAAAPDVILVSPCGYTAEQGANEYRSMNHSEEWDAVPAVRHGRVYALEANSYFSRPGPRLVLGIEALAKALHPELHIGAEPAYSVLPILDSTALARAASV